MYLTFTIKCSCYNRILPSLSHDLFVGRGRGAMQQPVSMPPGLVKPPPGMGRGKFMYEILVIDVFDSFGVKTFIISEFARDPHSNSGVELVCLYYSQACCLISSLKCRWEAAK